MLVLFFFLLALWMGSIFCYTATYFSLLDNREFESLQIESDDLKPGRKKKGRKPEIQVVTVDPPSSLPENIKGPRKADKKWSASRYCFEISRACAASSPQITDHWYRVILISLMNLFVSKVTGVSYFKISSTAG